MQNYHTTKPVLTASPRDTPCRTPQSKVSIILLPEDLRRVREWV